MGYHDTLMFFGVSRCPPGCSLISLCNIGTPIPIRVEHYGDIMFHAESHTPFEGEGQELHTILYGRFPYIRRKSFFVRVGEWIGRLFLPPFQQESLFADNEQPIRNGYEQVWIDKVYVDCYPDKDGAKGILQLTAPDGLDLDELLVSPRSK